GIFMPIKTVSGSVTKSLPESGLDNRVVEVKVGKTPESNSASGNATPYNSLPNSGRVCESGEWMPHKLMVSESVVPLCTRDALIHCSTWPVPPETTRLDAHLTGMVNLIAHVP